MRKWRLKTWKCNEIEQLCSLLRNEKWINKTIGRIFFTQYIWFLFEENQYF